MELLCIEVESEPKGYLDPVFLDDERVLGNLLQTEEKYTISSSYFNCFQTELQTYMRKIVCSWMLEVSVLHRLSVTCRTNFVSLDCVSHVSMHVKETASLVLPDDLSINIDTNEEQTHLFCFFDAVVSCDASLSSDSFILIPS